MKLILPTFKLTKIQSITACGSIVSEEKTIKKLLLKEQSIKAKYNFNKKNEILLTLIAGGKYNDHLHIELESQVIDDKKVPKLSKNSNLEKIVSFINKFQDQKIITTLWGVYYIKVQDIPENSFFKVWLNEKIMGNLSVQLTSGCLSISGAMIKGIEWQIKDDKSEVKITIESEIEETINDEYLLRINDWIDKLFDSYILNK